MILVRLLVLPVRLAFVLVGLALRLGFRAGRMPVRVTGRGVRRIGIRGWVFFVLGVAVGLLAAPFPGRELRRRLQERLEAAGGGSDDDLREKVAFELAHAPRTWHLGQPEVSVVAGRVTLRGTVDDSDARDELARVAGAIPGVAGVDNLITVGSTDGDAI